MSLILKASPGGKENGISQESDIGPDCDTFEKHCSTPPKQCLHHHFVPRYASH